MPYAPVSKLAAFLILLVALSPLSAVADDDTKEPESASDKEPAVTKLSGVFEAVNSGEIVVDVEHLSDLEIKRILPHGTRVKKGQNVVWFDTENIDKQVKDAEIELRLARLTLDEAELDHKQSLERQALDRAKAARTRENAQQDYDNFVQVDRERKIKEAEFDVKSSAASLDNVMEELEQLEQMYKEDDLTEESEEIVLRRAKQSVEFAQFRLEETEIESNRVIQQAIPRSDADAKDRLERAQIAYRKSLSSLEIANQRQRIEIERKRDDFADKQQNMKELRAERESIVLTAPNEGIVLHGKLTRGKLSDKASKLKVGSKVTADQVVATVVSPNKLQVRVDLAEDQLPIAKVGTKCKVMPKAFADVEFNGTVKSVSSVPYAGSKYDCVVSFRRSKNQPAVLPTMTCEIQFTDSQPDE